MSNRALAAIVIVLALLVGLAATNPTTPDYGAFLEAEVERALTKMDHTEAGQRTVMRDVLAAQGKSMIRSVIQTHTRRRSYGFFSLFETRLFQIDVRVVGIAGRFLPLEREDTLRKKLGQLVL